MDDQLQDFVQHMLDAGASKDTIDEGIRLYQSQHAATPVSQHDAGMGHDPIANAINRVSPGTGDYLEGAAQGLREGVVGGAKGFVKGLVPGAIEGVKGTLMSPITAGRAVKDAVVGGYNMVTDPVNTSKATLASIKTLPGKVYDSVAAKATQAAVDPEGFGNDVGHLTGGTMAAVATGAGVSKVIPLAPKPIARTVGKWAEEVGKHSQFGAGVVGLHQLASGNPAGIMTMGVPAALRAGGRKLQVLGGADLETALPSGARNIDVKGPINSIRLAPPSPDGVGRTPRVPYPAQEPVPYRSAAKAGVKAEEAAAANATRLAQINADVEGRVATDPAIKMSTSATAPDGSKVSSSRTFEQPKRTLAEKIDEAVANGTLRRKPEGPAAPTPTVNSNRAAGKAATDLAEGKAAPAPIAGPQSTLDDLATKIGTGVNEDAAVNALQLQTENAARLANRNSRVPPPEAVRAPRVVTQEAIPASKSKGAMSATPGLTRADLERVGMNPDLNYKNLTVEMIDKIKAGRSNAHGTHYANAATDKGLRSILEDSLLMRNMEKLR